MSGPRASRDRPLLRLALIEKLDPNAQFRRRQRQAIVQGYAKGLPGGTWRREARC